MNPQSNFGNTISSTVGSANSNSTCPNPVAAAITSAINSVSSGFDSRARFAAI